MQCPTSDHCLLASSLRSKLTLRSPVFICQNGSTRPLDAVTAHESLSCGLRGLCIQCAVLKNQRPDSKGNQRRGARAQPKLRVSGARRGGGSCLCLLSQEVCGLSQCTAPLHQEFWKNTMTQCIDMDSKSYIYIWHSPPNSLCSSCFVIQYWCRTFWVIWVETYLDNSCGKCYSTVIHVVVVHTRPRTK